MRTCTRPIWSISRHTWVGAQPNEASVPAQSRAPTVTSAYSSQECQRCHQVARANRPNQQTFWCGVCGHTNYADVNAAENLASRLGDHELAACADRQAIKALLERRHQDWQNIQRLAVVQPAAELSRQPAQL